jgi:hypothetical protein
VPEPLASVAGWLRDLDGDLDGVAMADVLWLAGVLFDPEPPKVPPVRRVEPDRAGTDDVKEPPPSTSDASIPLSPNTGSDISDQGHDIVAAMPDPGGDRVGTPIRMSTPRRLVTPLDLGRSLRALKRRWPVGRHSELDLDRTAAHFAMTRSLLPLVGPAPERWFELDLVIDDAVTMAVWEATVAGLAELLQHLGAFRTIRRWRLSSSGPRLVLRDTDARACSVDRLRTADHRRLVLILTDGVADSWAAPGTWLTLRRWAESTATALISLLPAKLHPLTKLDPARTMISSGSPHTGLRLHFPLRDRQVAVPILSLTPDSLRSWADTLMRGDPRGCDAILIPAGGRADENEPDESDEQFEGAFDAERRVEAFEILATEPARQLAILCSSFSHISLPVLQFVARTMVPTATAADLAEVVVSDLFDRSSGELLSFPPGVRATLQRRLIAPDVWRILDTLNQYVDDNSHAIQRLTTASAATRLRPFVEASMQVRQLLGLTVAMSRPVTEVMPDDIVVDLPIEDHVIAPAPSMSRRRPESEAPDCLIKYHRDDAKKAQQYHVGVELGGPHLRLAAFPVHARPTLRPADAFQRTGFFAAANHEWGFAPLSGIGGYTVAQETIAAVSYVLRTFLDDMEIEPTQVARLRVGGIVTFDKNGLVVRVNTDSLRDRLARDFADVLDLGFGTRIHDAIRVERRYGAGVEIRPSTAILYARISENLSLGADPGVWTYDGVFAPRIQHSRVNRDLLEQLGPEFIDGSYVATSPRPCQICGRDCLHSIASGTGILDLVASHPTAVKAAVDGATVGSWRFAEDRGARLSLSGTVIDSGAVFRAAATDETCRRIVLQAGLALAIAIHERIIEQDVFEPDLVVVGGTVPVGTIDEDRLALDTRRTIDGVMQRTLQHLGRIGHLPVTRSRFAGYTDLLGMTVS